MKITITNDEGEVYVVASHPVLDPRLGWTALDEEGDRVRVAGLLTDARQWEEGTGPEVSPHALAIPCVAGPQPVNSTADYCTAHGARWVHGDDACWGVRYYGARAVQS